MCVCCYDKTNTECKFPPIPAAFPEGFTWGSFFHFQTVQAPHPSCSSPSRCPGPAADPAPAVSDQTPNQSVARPHPWAERQRPKSFSCIQAFITQPHPPHPAVLHSLSHSHPSFAGRLASLAVPDCVHLVLESGEQPCAAIAAPCDVPKSPSASWPAETPWTCSPPGSPSRPPEAAVSGRPPCFCVLGSDLDVSYPSNQCHSSELEALCKGGLDAEARKDQKEVTAGEIGGGARRNPLNCLHVSWKSKIISKSKFI